MTKIRISTRASFIHTDADIAKGVRALRRACPIMRHVYITAGDPPLRRRAAGFEGLSRIIVGQQLSTASAGAIWDRLIAALQPVSAEGVLAATDERLRACGLSGGKIRTLRALAAAVEAGALDLAALESRGDEEVHAHLTDLSTHPARVRSAPTEAPTLPVSDYR